MYDGMFIVGIETPEGQATYHYDIDPYWDIFNVQELDRAPKWDGHTPTDAINRIRSIPDIETLEPIFSIPTKSEFYDLYLRCEGNVNLLYESLFGKNTIMKEKNYHTI